MFYLICTYTAKKLAQPRRKNSTDASALSARFSISEKDNLSKKAANWGSIWNNSSLVAGAAWESRPYRLSWHFQSPRHRGTAHQNRSWVRWQNTHRCWSWSSCPHSPNPISCTIYVVVIIKRRSALSKYVENFYLRMLWNWITIHNTCWHMHLQSRHLGRPGTLAITWSSLLNGISW